MILLSGNAFASLLLLARNLIVARLIPVEDYGIAATFAVAMAVVEMMSALGLQQQIVQAKEGDNPHFQAALQGFQVLRGAISGAVLFLIAGPLARFLGIGEVAWAYQLLALVPVLNALQHFDIYRMNRKMAFGPMLITKAAPALLSVLAVWPLSIWYGDYTVMLYSILIQAAIGTVTSHLVAERPYRLAFDREIMGNSLRFGWPILVNGILMFLVFQGDKLIVGRELGMEALALFAMGMTLTLTPTLVLVGSVSNLVLPKLSASDRTANNTARAFQRVADVVLQISLLIGATLVLASVLFGSTVVELLLGPKYQALVPILVWLSIQQALRASKSGPAIIALARGQTILSLWSNIFRVILLIPAWQIAKNGGDVMMVIWIGIIGELIGFWVALALMRHRLGVSLRGYILPFVFSHLLIFSSLSHFYLKGHSGSLSILTASAMIIFGICSIAAMQDLRYFLRKRIST
jgi:O-antigen/teichoic acid export membrane protein